MILAGDVGGTKTFLGLFEPLTNRPRAVAVRAFHTLEHADLRSMISVFSKDEQIHGHSIDVACFGVAGPVLGDTAELTNASWHVDAGTVAKGFNIRRVALLNDLEAMAYSIPVLDETELHDLQKGEGVFNGNMALIAAGTGLGEALLHSIQGRFVASASEGGHADFAARTDFEIQLMRNLTSRFGRAEVEQVVSGMGLVNLHRLTHGNRACPALTDQKEPDLPPLISKAALERRCPDCVEALYGFVDAYGAEAGNLALRAVSRGGLFIGGGIAPKILPALTDGRFMRAFRAKAPLEHLLARVPVRVILNEEAGLLGAAVYGMGLRR